ncbi:hypothetical protein BO70DRAFT_397635 [Aspergillus heteromorphus CBS 117.55]|uniref:Integral membrane protein n=1 Tax=Aspergillus heteromorphus CBS 117.55 TaxID=1448321 RepID=A0A317VSI9_9EURO|nr:uncharacterized protein BO70DRAFT_397635 [Aspergillus heteromorphus CBS 117.55]PWY77344.1 hypothetical protein BO70DRAFT_397635 [Aspergillus heteromorphus CBS 117.55]
MYCQQRLFAFLYAVLGVFTNTTLEIPPLIPYEANGGQYRTECASTLSSISQYITVSEVLDQDGPGCAVSLTNPMGWDTRPSLNANEPALKLTFTLTYPGKRSMNLQCDTLLEGLIFSQDPETNLGNLRSDIRLPLPSASQVYARRTLWQGEPEKDPQADSPTQGYHGILKYIISKMNGMGPAKRSNGEALVPFSQRPAVQRDLYSLGPICEDIVCEGYDWEEICISSAIPADRQEQCLMCYPQKHMGLVRHYCQERRYTELDVFYKACALLGASVLGATLIYLLREIGRRLRMRCRFFQNICPQLSDTTTKTGLSSIYSLGSVEMPTATSTMIQQRFKRFGPFTKESRRRVQDVFDLESFEAYRGEPEVDNLKRIPVLPRAPNASVRRHSSAWKSRTNSHINGDEKPDNVGERALISFEGTLSQSSYYA